MNVGGGFTARIEAGVLIQKLPNLVLERSDDLVVYICEPRADAPRD
jgi:hypothetical protein